MVLKEGGFVKSRSIACVTFLSLMLALPGPVAAQGAAMPNPAYRINPGDDLEISVWGEERLQRVVRVLPDGTFGFPLVGQIVALGRLPAELEARISKGLEPQYRGAVPQVTVSVKSPSGFQFSVIGKVRNPGTFTPGRYVNALEALSMAGGPTEFAQVGAIRIVRKTGQQLNTIRVRMSGAIKGEADALTSNDIPSIISGDTLVVP